jgi:PE family protein
MPFWKDGTDAGPSTSTLRVDPAQVLQLKAELQPIYDEVEEFLARRAPVMMMRPLGADPVSSETAQAFNENSQAAIDAARGYLAELKNVIGTLDQAAKTYNLVEDNNTQVFRHGVQ